MAIFYLSAWALAVAIALGAWAAGRKGGEGCPGAEQKDGQGEAARRVVAHAYWELSRHGAPCLWRLSSVVKHAGPITPEVALRAMMETRAELAGRYKTAALDNAITALQEISPL